MSVVGIDLGNYHCSIGIARNKNIDIIANENSNRNTKNIISLKDEFRNIGDNAQPLLITNYKHSFYNLKYLLGLKYKDINPDEYPFIMVEKEDGFIGYKYNDDILDDIQLLAMLFSKFKQQIVEETKNNVSNLVVTVPSYYTNRQRKLMVQAGLIIDIKIDLINEYIAAGLDYGIWKTANKEFSDENTHFVLFIDIGYSSSSYSLINFYQTALDIRNVITDTSICGRNIDLGIYRLLEKQLVQKFNIDISQYPKSKAKMLVEAEKIKKQFSLGNKVVKSTIEYIHQDQDLIYSISLEEYMEILNPMLDNITNNIKLVLDSQKINTIEDLQAIELIGGTTRIPLIKDTINKSTGIVPKTTLNADETNAKGAALYAAFNSGRFRSFEYLISDIYPHIIQAINSNTDDFDQVNLITNEDRLPKKKRLRFKYADNLTMSIVENGDTILTFKDIQFDKIEERINIYLTIGLDGIIQFNNCDYTYKEENDDGKKIKKTDLVELTTINTPIIDLDKFKEYEKQSFEIYQHFLLKNDKKNDFENLLLNTRNIIDKCQIELDKEYILKEIDRLEDWLYEEDLYSLEQYNDSISSFNSLIEPINQQRIEIQVVQECINKLQQIIYNHNYKPPKLEDVMLIENYDKIIELCQISQELINNAKVDLDQFNIGQIMSNNLLNLSNKYNEISQQISSIHTNIKIQEKKNSDQQKIQLDAEKKKNNKCKIDEQPPIDVNSKIDVEPKIDVEIDTNIQEDNIKLDDDTIIDNKNDNQPDISCSL